MHTPTTRKFIASKTGEAISLERRKHWRDRRVSPDRRSPERLEHSEYDCRSGVPRRASDIAGELADGEVWWETRDTP